MKHIWKHPGIAGLATLAALGLAAAQPAMAQSLTGFGSFAAPNGSATLNSGVLQLTDGQGGEAGSMWSSAVQPVGAWTASFNYQDTDKGGADGFSFALQNQGTAALGAGGGALGYSGITGNSAAAQFSLWNGGSMGFGLNGGIDKQHYSPANDVLGTGDLLNITVSYANSWVTQTVTDPTSSTTYSSTFYANLGNLFAGNSGQAYVGFTGGTGGAASTQQISNFTFTGQTAPVSTNLAAPLAVTGYNSNVIQNTAGEAVSAFDVPNQYAFYTTNDSTMASGGLPANGQVTVSGFSSGPTFQLGSYAATDKNALLLSTFPTISAGDGSSTSTFSSTGTLTLANPGNFSEVGVLSAAANGNSIVSVTFNYSDGTTSVQQLHVTDWYNAAAGIAIGRIGIGTNTDTGGTGGPSLHQDYLPTDPTKTLDSIAFDDTLDNGTGTVAGIFAVNGIAAAPEPGELAALTLGAFGLLGLIAKKRRASVS